MLWSELDIGGLAERRSAIRSTVVLPLLTQVVMSECIPLFLLKSSALARSDKCRRL